MTTPDERRRNVLWGRETLAELAEDQTLALAWRQEAADLLAAYLSRMSARSKTQNGSSPSISPP